MQNFHSLDHCGQRECQHRVSQAYFWPKMNKQIAKYVKTCHACQSAKSTIKIKPKAKQFPVEQERFAHLHTDVVGPLPESEGMRYILTILDRRTRWLECVAMSQATSKNVCNGFIRAWLSRYGQPQTITCDNGSTYTAKLWDDLTRVLGIKVNFVPPFHQSTNGAIERQHKTLKESIKASLIEMGDVHRSNWMQQLPFTLLGRRVSLQPDLGASPSDLTLGGPVLLPGVLVPDEANKTIPSHDSHDLLKTVQSNISTPAVQMSRHGPEPEVFEPKDFHSASHVYLKVESPENLGKSYIGPFPIISRPSNTTVRIRTGHTAQGVPREEVHHWNNLRIAYLRPDQVEGQRPKRGRPARNSEFNMAAENIVVMPNDFRANESEHENQLLTQPRQQPGAHQFQIPALGAGTGSENNTPSLTNDVTTNDAWQLPITGPPPAQPFRQNQNNLSSLPERIPGPKPVTREPLPRQASGGLAPPVTKGAPQTGPPPSPINFTPSAEPQIGHHLIDHDYIRRPSAVQDHDYFAPQPNPPPGFSTTEGKPKRITKVPERYYDYEMY